MDHKNKIFAGFVSILAFVLILAACSPASVPSAAPQATIPVATAQLPNTGATSTSSPASQSAIVDVKVNKDLGNILAASNGRTLYIYTKDTADSSNCYDKCASAWPPLTVSQGAALNAGSGVNVKLGTTQRKDGSMQVTVNGMPVYFWFKDQSGDDATGQGVGSVWFVLDASGNVVQTPLPVTPTAPGATAAPAATVAPAASTDIVDVEDSALGKILTDNKGMTLYVFTNDTPNTSNCYDKCATNWPPLTVPQGTELKGGSSFTGQLGTTTRKDGSLQVTVNEMPVYYFFKDVKAGDTTGQGVGSVWFVLDAAGNMIQQEAPSASPTAAPANNSYSSNYP